MTKAELIEALAPHGLLFPGGHCSDVGLGGFLLQGGFGWNGRAFGPACASLRAIDVVTADGQIRNCLFARSESDLRSALRSGASDEEIAGRWRAAVASKLPGHGINDPAFLQPDRPM